MAQRSNYPDQLLSDALPVLDAVIMDELERQPDMIPAVFNVMSSSRWGEQSTTMSGLKAAISKVEGDAVVFDDAIEGFDKTYTHVTYALAVSFSKEMIEDDRFDVVGSQYRNLGLSMHQTRQIQAADILNSGFSDTGPDGVSLFNSAHPLIGGGTYQNRPSSDIAASVGGLREMEIEMMRQVNDRNINVVLMPRMLMGPPELKHVLTELVKSEDRPDTANRAMNTFFMENYNLVISPFLTSSTAWYAFADKSSHNLRFYDRVGPQTKTWEDEKSGDVNTSIRCRFSVGYSDWKGAWGTTG